MPFLVLGWHVVGVVGRGRSGGFAGIGVMVLRSLLVRQGGKRVVVIRTGFVLVLRLASERMTVGGCRVVEGNAVAAAWLAPEVAVGRNAASEAKFELQVVGNSSDVVEMYRPGYLQWFS